MTDETPNLGKALVRRVDGLEQRQDQTERSLGKLDRAVKTALAAREQASAGQPDWLSCRDPGQARAMLSGAVEWLDSHGALLGLRPYPCWPWHPAAVAIVLAAAQHYASAYSGDSAPGVTDYLTRYVPAVTETLRRGLGECDDNTHRVGVAPFVPDLDRLDALAIWWASDRTGPMPGLRPRMAATG